MTREPEQLSEAPVRLGRRRSREEPDLHDEHVAGDGFSAREVQHEMLDARPEPTWRPPRWVVVAALLVGLVASAGWYADRQERASETRALEGCHRELHSAVVFADLRLMARADHLAPTLSASDGVRRGHIADLMAQPARTVLGPVERADQACRGVSIRPWHFSLASERTAATAYSGALVERIRSIAGRGRSYYGAIGSLLRLRAAAGIHIIGGPF